MNKTLLLLFAALLPLLCFTACSDDDDSTDTGEFSYNWQARNADYFVAQMSQAKAAIAEAKAQYGDDWESHTTWRVARSYAKVNASSVTDSICYEIVQRGTGSGCPLYTDSVKIAYIGRLMPTESYAQGLAFDRSGYTESEEDVFGADFGRGSKFLASGVVEGLTTALMYMHIGDRWRVYMPQQLGYKSASQGVLPAYSTLVFDCQLKGYCRANSDGVVW